MRVLEAPVAELFFDTGFPEYVVNGFLIFEMLIRIGAV